MAIKQVGIVCDNYKQDRFEEELKKNGFNQYEVNTLTPEAKIIKVEVDDKLLDKFATMVKMVNNSFKS